MKKILITGGLGFLGVHSIIKWKSMGWEVTVIDNLSSNTINPDDPICKGCTIIVDDFLNTKWDKMGKYDLILHLASPVGPLGVLKHSGKMAREILDDTYTAIEGALHNDCPLIFISTSEIYGYREFKSYLKETDDKVLKGEFSVRNEYAQAKLLCELVLSNTAKINKKFKYQIIRPFNISGAYQLPTNGFVLPRFVTQALSGEDITVYNSGEQRRAFTWVKDIVEGIYLTSNPPESRWNEEWNIGNESNETTINYFAEKVKELTKSNSIISHVDPKKLHGLLFEEAPDKIPNSSKIRDVLGWNPTKDIDSIIQEVVNFYVSK